MYATCLVKLDREMVAYHFTWIAYHFTWKLHNMWTHEKTYSWSFPLQSLPIFFIYSLAGAIRVKASEGNDSEITQVSEYTTFKCKIPSSTDSSIDDDTHTSPCKVGIESE